jgi:hypothetical protein
MKRIIFAMSFITAGVLSISAQKINTDKVSSESRQAFIKAHPGKTGKWEMEKGNYEVNFKENGKTRTCVLDNKGTILETKTDIKDSELPQSVREYVKAHYKLAAIKEAARIIKQDGTVNYEAEVNRKEVVFNSNGKFINEEKE